MSSKNKFNPLILPENLKNKTKIKCPVILVTGSFMWKKIIKHFKPAKKQINDLGYLHFFRIQNQQQAIIIAGSSLGAPAAAMSLERLIYMGAKEILVFGACGSINSLFKNGTIIMPVKAISEEGTSKLYPDSSKISTPDKNLASQLVDYFMNQKKIQAKKGTIWTTDGFFRETKEKINKYNQLGAIAVEMELSALFNIAKYKKVKLASIQLVSDELFEKKWISIAEKKNFSKKFDECIEHLKQFLLKGEK